MGYFVFVGIICYDDACHLKKFAQNPVRSDLTGIAKKIKKMSLVCDKFHFRNHVDRWCKANCNPFTTTELEVNVFEVKHKCPKKKGRSKCTTTSPVIIVIIIHWCHQLDFDWL